MALAAATTLITSSFLRPDARQIATFFLGAVFFESLRCVLISPFFREFVGRAGRAPASTEFVSEKAAHRSSAGPGTHIAYLAMDMLLPISFCVASLSHFSSLLAFEPAGITGCAFVVALGGITQQLGRLIASLIILVDLHRFLHKFEVFGSVIWLMLGAAAAFADNALSVGILQNFAPLNASFCIRKRLAVPAVVAFVLYLIIQLYFIARTWAIFSGRKHQQLARSVLADARMMRPLALILFEALVLIPSVSNVDAVGEFIPFSIGVLLVLAAFSAKSKLTHAKLQPDAERVVEIAPLPWSPHPSPLPFRMPSRDVSVSSRPNRDRQGLSMITDTLGRSGHPFAASALNDRTLLRHGNQTPEGGNSRLSSTTENNSIEEGVIQTASSAPPVRATLMTTNTVRVNPPQTPWTHRRIATPDQLNSFSAQQEEASRKTPPPLSGIPPPPLSARRPPPLPEPALRSNVVDDPVSPASTRIYGSDIIRMTSNASSMQRDFLKRLTMDTMGGHSDISTQHTHGDYYGDFSSPRTSYQTQAFGGSRHHASGRGGSMFDGRRKSSVKSKRTTAVSLGQLDWPPVAPSVPPVPGMQSPRPLPATPTDPSMR